MSADERTLGERVEAVRLALSTDLFQDGLLRAMVSQEAAALLLEQQAEIERLTDRCALLRVTELERDLEAARVDAERYRWLRDTGRLAPFQIMSSTLQQWDLDDEMRRQLDAAIDLARARGEGNDDE